MNEGLYGFSRINSGGAQGSLISRVEFDYSGVYRIPDNASFLTVWAVGGGGGGARAANDITATGGGAGSMGGRVCFAPDLPVEHFGGRGQDIVVAIGAGGLGGAGGTTNGSNGSSGSIGNNTLLLLPSGKTLLTALGSASNASAGTTTTGGAAASSLRVFFHYLVTGTVSANGILSNTGTNGGLSTKGSDNNVSTVVACGGTGGGGLSTSAAFTGGRQGLASVPDTENLLTTRLVTGNYIMEGGAIGSNGVTAVEMIGSSPYSCGFGGTGGGSGRTQNAGNGGNGYRGGGGGGGGASAANFTAGTGGRGGNGYVLIEAYR